MKMLTPKLSHAISALTLVLDTELRLFGSCEARPPFVGTQQSGRTSKVSTPAPGAPPSMPRAMIVWIPSSSSSVRLRLPEDTGAGKAKVFFQAEDGIRDYKVTGVQTCALPI